MLNSIKVDAVIRDDRATGTFPSEIHEGVGWWVASCFVIVARTSALVLAHDGSPAGELFVDRMGNGATNAQHYACQVSVLGQADETQLLDAARQLGGVPAARVSADGTTVTIDLYAEDGSRITEETGWAKIRDQIRNDQVPRPVNDQAKGCVINRADLLTTATAA
ncbi:hypothetical protein [Streptomyces sp. NPDC051776]|uniref:hypothetical protein n=1 Tax=Streptomyces sp. NPDC051776 TaxID=3155414 RepID=UPI00341766F9